MDAQSKLRIIDSLSLLLSLIAFAGVAYILILDNFQFLFNWKILLWVGAISIISFFLIRRRQRIFRETL
ncbi:MAG: hypothetical protein FJ358_01785 [Thaumarchaeota archaeon]|nr:hypothetical protein [Nitrososphaerota archaeon]